MRLRAMVCLAVLLTVAHLTAFRGPDLLFPLRPSRDGRYLIDARSRPVFYHADTAWALPKKATVADANEYFARRRRGVHGDPDARGIEGSRSAPEQPTWRDRRQRGTFGGCSSPASRPSPKGHKSIGRPVGAARLVGMPAFNPGVGLRLTS